MGSQVTTVDEYLDGLEPERFAAVMRDWLARAA